jgi:hypothetical protein
VPTPATGYPVVVIVRVGALTTAVLLVGGGFLVGGCSWAGPEDGRDRNPANQPGYLLPDPPRSDSTERAPHVVTGRADRVRDAATFELVNGADVVRVSVRDLGTDVSHGSTLFRVSTPADAKVVPSVNEDGWTVVAGLRDTGLGGPAVVTVELSDDVAWTVRLAGGATDETVDLTGGRGGNVDFSAGTSRATVTLPAASGTQRVTMSGGASQFAVRLAGNAPVRVAAKGGAGSVTVDGETHSGVAGGSIWTPDDWAAASSRYDIDATAGVSTMTVARS